MSTRIHVQYTQRSTVAPGAGLFGTAGTIAGDHIDIDVRHDGMLSAEGSRAWVEQVLPTVTEAINQLVYEPDEEQPERGPGVTVQWNDEPLLTTEAIVETFAPRPINFHELVDLAPGSIIMDRDGDVWTRAAVGEQYSQGWRFRADKAYGGAPTALYAPYTLLYEAPQAGAVDQTEVGGLLDEDI